MRFFFDDNGALSIALNPVQHSRTKDVEVDRHFIGEKVDDSLIYLSYVRTKQVEDVLIKGFAKDQFECLINKLDMINIYDPTLRECMYVVINCNYCKYQKISPREINVECDFQGIVEKRNYRDLVYYDLFRLLG